MLESSSDFSEMNSKIDNLSDDKPSANLMNKMQTYKGAEAGVKEKQNEHMTNAGSRMGRGSKTSRDSYQKKSLSNHSRRGTPTNF
jgi:hypothetical protein